MNRPEPPTNSKINQTFLHDGLLGRMVGRQRKRFLVVPRVGGRGRRGRLPHRRERCLLGGRVLPVRLLRLLGGRLVSRRL